MVKGKHWPEINRIYQADALAFLCSLPDNSIDMAITSPPYWNLRDYGVEGQLGLEPTFHEYLDKLCVIFDEVKRVLKPEGTCWVNLGDTYSGNKQGKTDYKVSHYLKDNSKGINKKAVITEKCLCQIPSRFAVEMCKRGWLLRNEIIWHKPNCMPSSVKDRFTVDFEKLFLFVKSKKYYFEPQYEPWKDSSVKRATGNIYSQKAGNYAGFSCERQRKAWDKFLQNGTGRNKRCVWTIPTKPFKEAHFATFPEKLIETPIKAGCPVNGIVLDIFMGAGTTALTALKLGRNFLGCELNPAYIEIAEQRLKPYLEPLREAA